MSTAVRRATAAGAMLAAAALIGPIAATTPAVAATPASTASDRTVAPSAEITRMKVIARAKTWLNPPVPYSQSKTHKGYRTDCSGYVSMAWRLPAKGLSVPNTVKLASSKYTKKIKKSQLKAGDILIDYAGTNTTRHVVIFEKWANSAKNAYVGYEQTGGAGHTVHRRIPYPYFSSKDEYEPRRYKRIVGGGIPKPTAYQAR